jgi:uncharacterized membrane protein YgcG
VLFRAMGVWLVLMLALGGQGAVRGAALPPPTRYVADYADLFDAAREDELNGLLQQLRLGTGVQYIILTVRNTKGLTVQQYARRLAQLWKPPQSDGEKTVLFAFSTQENAYCFEVGRDLKDFLTERYFAQASGGGLEGRVQADAASDSVYTYNLRVIQRIARQYGVRLSDTLQASGKVPGTRVPAPGRPWIRWGTLWLAGLSGTLLCIWLRRRVRRSLGTRAWSGTPAQSAGSGPYGSHGGGAFGGGFGAFGAGFCWPGSAGKDDLR